MPQTATVSYSLYSKMLQIKAGLEKEKTRLRQTIEKSLALMETPEGLMDAKILLWEIYADTEPRPVDTKEDCGCRDKKAKAKQQQVPVSA